MKLKIILPLLLVLATMIGLLCTRNPIGDRILAKACILGSSKYGQCQLAK